MPLCLSGECSRSGQFPAGRISERNIGHNFPNLSKSADVLPRHGHRRARLQYGKLCSGGMAQEKQVSGARCRVSGEVLGAGYWGLGKSGTPTDWLRYQDPGFRTPFRVCWYRQAPAPDVGRELARSERKISATHACSHCRLSKMYQK